VYFAYNVDKALLGRFWGADALGIYSRAYQLVNLPTDGLNSAISSVALPALARVQNDADRLRRYFVQGYGVFLAIMAPVTAACALFADDIVRVFLGPKWAEAASIFRLLTPTMLVFALINPLSWMLFATGRTTRSLAMACLIAPTAIAGYSIGLFWGPQGVAIGFSGAMLLLAIPMVLWARHETAVTVHDIAGAAWPVLASALIAGVVSSVATLYLRRVELPLVRLSAESAVLFIVFGLMMWLLLRDSSVYRKMWQDARVIPGFSRISE